MADRVAAIIPAFNEAATVAEVVGAVRASGLADRVIVVSDGSTDRTAEAARPYADLVVASAWNRGKGGAMRLGASFTDAPVLLFLDADIKGFGAEHFRKMLEPVVAGRVDMNVGLIVRGPIYTWLARRLPLISGQRAVRRELFEAAARSGLSGYGAEVSLNAAARHGGFRVGLVTLRGLTVIKKCGKVGWGMAVAQYVRMFWQVGWAMLSARFGR